MLFLLENGGAPYWDSAFSVITIFYREPQHLYTHFLAKMALKKIKVNLVNEHPQNFTPYETKNAKDSLEKSQCLFIIDDPSIEYLKKPVLSDYITHCRHKNISIFLILHKIFGPDNTFRRMISNFSVFFFTVSRRSIKDISLIDSQNCLNGKLKSIYLYLLEQESYKFLIVDLLPSSPEKYRFRTVNPSGKIIIFS